METVIKQIQHQLKQKREQVSSLQKQLETAKHEEVELVQAMKALSSQISTTQNNSEPVEVINIPSSSSQSPEKTQQEESKSISNISTTRKSWADEVEEAEVAEIEEKAAKWYVIFNGPHKGIYNNWGIANSHIVGKNVSHKSYKTKQEAEQAFKESYKTMVTTEAKELPSKTVSLGVIPRSSPRNSPELNKLNAKAILDAIPTTKEKEQMKKASTEKFEKLWDSLVSYTETHKLMGFYPTRRRAGPKAVFLADITDSMTLWEYFTHGFIDTIYLNGDDLQCISEFPTRVQVIIKNYKARFAKERSLFIKLNSSYPIFDEESQILVPSISLAYMGVSNGNQPLRDELPHEVPTANNLILSLASIYLATSRIGKGTGQKSQIRVNYCSKNLLIYSTSDKEITEEELKAVEIFEEPFEKFSHYLAQLPEEIKKQLCKHVLHAPRHQCEFCKENLEDTPFMDDE